MMRYLIEPKDHIFVKGYRILSFAKNMCQNIDKNISKDLRKYMQKRLDHANQSAIDALKTASKRVIQKIA